jgi:hypothetical protein
VTGEIVEWTRLDRFLAIAAGPANWRDDRGPSSADLAAGCIELAAFGAILTVSTNAALRHRGEWDPWVPVALVACLIVLFVALAGPTARWVFGAARPRRGPRGDIRLVAIARTIGFGVMCVLWSVVVRGVRVQDTWLFGVVVGCEATLAARSIGASMRPWQWWRQFLLSYFHFLLVVFAVVIGVRFDAGEGWLVGAEVYVAVQFAVLVAVSECWALERIRSRLDAELTQHRQAVEQLQHRERAHWLHDDVCSELRLLRLKLETQHLTPDEIATQLDELDHRLRVRQLDELLQSGGVRLAEVIQPFVRRAQAHGLRVREVPRFEQASLEIDERTGRLVQHAAAVLVTNSIQAGATEIAIRAEIDRSEGWFELRFDDDAGGFDHQTIPPGRGLDSLCHELGPGSLELHHTDGGTSARVMFAFDPDENRA